MLQLLGATLTLFVSHGNSSKKSKLLICQIDLTFDRPALIETSKIQQQKRAIDEWFTDGACIGINFYHFQLPSCKAEYHFVCLTEIQSLYF